MTQAEEIHRDRAELGEEATIKLLTKCQANVRALCMVEAQQQVHRSSLATRPPSPPLPPPQPSPPSPPSPPPPSPPLRYLFVGGFCASAVVGTVVGSYADKFGRRKFAILYCVIYFGNPSPTLTLTLT